MNSNPDYIWPGPPDNFLSPLRRITIPYCYANIDVIFAHEISDKNVIFSLVLMGFHRIFDARRSPDCYGKIDVIFAHEINDKNVIFSLVLMGFHQIFESRRSPDCYSNIDVILPMKLVIKTSFSL